MCRVSSKGVKHSWVSSSLTARISELEFSLETKKKSRMETSTSIGKMKSRGDEALRALQQEKESQARDREAYEVGWLD